MSNTNENLASLKVRKIVSQTEDVLVEGGRSVDVVPRKAVVCAVFENPWAGQGFVEDLWDKMNWVGRILSHELGGRALELVGGKDKLLGFGKCALIGINGEIEHGAGIIHGPDFGPRFRDMTDGTAGISAVERRAAPGLTISIPTNHKSHRATRAFYQSVDFTLNDAPHPNEIAIAIAVVSGARAHERVGDLTTDAARKAAN